MPEGYLPGEWEEQKKWMIKKVTGVFTTVGSNEMAAFYVYVATFLGGLLWHCRRAFWRVLVPIEVVLLVMAIVYSESRGALLSVIAGVGYSFTRGKKWVNRAAVVVCFFLPAFASDMSAATRFDLWKSAIRFGIQYPLGIGYHVFPLKNQEVNDLKLDTHNYFLRALAEIGPIGFFCIVSAFLACIKLGWMLHDTARTDFSKGIGRGCAMMWASAVVCNMFGDRMSHGHTGIVVWSLTGLATALLLQEQRARHAAEVVHVAPQLDPCLGQAELVAR